MPILVRMMNKFIALLILSVSQPVWADCAVHMVNQMISEHRVSEPVDLQKFKSPGKCRVTFRMSINDKWFNVDREVTGLEEEDSLCRQAISNAREDLMVQMGGTFQMETKTRCTEGQAEEFQSVKIGQTVMESEVGLVPNQTKYFTYKHAQCRLFRERVAQNGKLRVNHGVICQTDHQDWIVVDKW